MGDFQLNISIPLDDKGMMGRECLECERYFKLKPGTGLQGTTHCHCPYCEYSGEYDTFWTPAQIEYAHSVAMNEAFKTILKPSLMKLNQAFKDLERKTRNGFIQLKVKTPSLNFSVPVKYYNEHDVETDVTCDSCGLIFSVYGVFGRCPDCAQTNAFLIFDKSMEVTEKQFTIFSNPEIPEDIVEKGLSLVISSSVSAFDGLGKELRIKRPELYPPKPKNLFQNLAVLNGGLNNLISDNHNNYANLLKLFQVRHLYEHNMGVVDTDFVNKVPSYSSMLGRKYPLTIDEVKQFIQDMRELAIIIKNHYKASQL